MTVLYPGALDSLPTNHLDNVQEFIHASTVNDICSAINAIEAALGATPYGSYTTVKAYLDAIKQAMGGVNVCDYGADLTGASASTTAFQNALAAIDTVGNDRGGVLIVPRGFYKVAPISWASATPLVIRGEVASMGNITGSTGTTLFPTGNNQTILTLGDGVTTYQEGAVVSDLNFYANGQTGCTGLLATGINRWKGIRLGTKDLDIGVEQRASASTDNAWSLLDDCMFVNSKVAGLKTYDAFGLTMRAGGILVPDIASQTSYGIYCTGGVGEASQSIKVHGTFIDGTSHPAGGTAVGVFLERCHDFLGEAIKFEQLDLGADITQADAGDSSAGAANTLAFCSWTGQAADTGLKVRANASAVNVIVPDMISPLGTGIDNSGTRTKVFGGRLDVTTPWTGTLPEFHGTDMPDGGSGRFSQTVLGSGSAADKLGFYGHTPATKPTITGSRGANAALASLLTQLASLGLITDSTS